MSFSKDVKEELAKKVSGARHCRIAELAGIISLCGKIIISSRDEYFIKIHTENKAVAKKYFTLIAKTFNIYTEISIKYKEGLIIYTLVIKNPKISWKILQAIKLVDENGEINENLSVNNIVIQKTCCKRAFLRGAFLAQGSISNPNKTYHFEIVTTTLDKAKQLVNIISVFEIEARIVIRKKYYVIYVKEGSHIVDLLNIMEASVALMELENIRILKEMRNSVNRQVNCETANINKTVKASKKQLEDILYIKNIEGFSNLQDNLKDIAILRIENPEASLKELGEMLSIPIGKSGVNHRLRKLSLIADSLREQTQGGNENVNKENQN